MHTDKHRYLSVFIGVYLWLDFQNMNSKSYDFRQITLNTSLRVERSNRRVLVIASLKYPSPAGDATRTGRLRLRNDGY